MGARSLAEGVDVAAEGVERRPRVLDEIRLGSAAREGLEAERAGAGEGVEHDRVGQDVRVRAVREDVEERLARAVARRPYVASGRRDDGAAAVPTADDPHCRA